jgi:ribosomal protein S10
MKYKIYLLSQKVLLLNNFSQKLKNLLNLIGLCSIVKLPVKIQKFTLLSSPHVNKKSREQFEIKTYKRLLVINVKNKDVIFPLINQFYLKLPQGLSIKIVYSTN